MSLINVGELIGDPDFAQPNGITVIHRVGSIVNHKPVITEKVVTYTGTITISSEVTTTMESTADKTAESIHVYTNAPLTATGSLTDEEAIASKIQLADLIVWNGLRYKVMAVSNYLQYGYVRATAERLRQDVG